MSRFLRVTTNEVNWIHDSSKIMHTGLENYFGIIACVTTIVTVGTLLQFENEPPVPPSSSELEKLIRGEEEPPFLESVQKFFSTKGFSRALVAFICSISITNVVGVRSSYVDMFL